MSDDKLGTYITKLMTTILDKEQEDFVKELAMSELKRLNVNITDFLNKHIKSMEKETTKKASEKQLFVIQKNNLHDTPETLSSSEASALISEFMENKTESPRVDKDKEIYEEYRQTIEGISSNDTIMDVARDMINQCPKNYREDLRKIANEKFKELEKIPH